MYTDAEATLEINGHTSSQWGNTQLPLRYLNNEKLSMNRAMSVIEYLFSQQNTPTQQWLAKVLKGSGVAYKERVLHNNKEVQSKSRRVTFKIIVKNQPQEGTSPSEAYFQTKS
jgi:flagellar motor protein MotB